jgi:predicted negative regulator of RcsB-dependent stress response
MAKPSKEVKVEKNFEKSLGSIKLWYNKYEKVLLGVLIAIVVIIAGAIAYKYLYLAPKNEEANVAIFNAQNAFDAKNYDLAINGDSENLGFLAITDDYSGTDAANLSHYYLALVYFEQANYEDAIVHLKDFNAKKDLFLAPRRLELLGDANAQLNDLSAALEYYSQAINSSDNEIVVPRIIVKAAAIHDIQGDTQKALSLYETLKDKYSKSSEAREADKYISMLKAKLNLN